MLSVTRYKLPTSRPLRLAQGGKQLFREGLLLHDPVRGGWGEAAPLPGFSPESLAQMIDALQTGKSPAFFCPSMDWALDCVRRPPVLPEKPVGVNRLWFPEQEPVEEMLQRLSGAVRPVIKVKLGPNPDPRPLKALAGEKPDLGYRLDANRQWDMDTLLRFFRELPEENIEYFEEPLANPAEYARLQNSAPVPLALDESLRTQGWETTAANPFVRALVLKPTMTGGRAALRPYLDFARRQGQEIVVSSCFESGVGLWHLAVLAAETAPDGAHGLDTGDLFEADTVEPRPVAFGGALPGGGVAFSVIRGGRPVCELPDGTC